MTSPFLSARAPHAPADLIAMAKGFAAPRVAIARPGAALPMGAAGDGPKAGIRTPGFGGEAGGIRAEAAKPNGDI